MSIPSYCKHPRGSFPWDIYKLVSDSPHGLDIFFFCNLPQLLADICNDTEYRATYIHRILLPDRLIDLFFRVDSSWLTGKVHQSLKFIRFRQRKHMRILMGSRTISLKLRPVKIVNLIIQYPFLYTSKMLLQNF